MRCSRVVIYQARLFCHVRTHSCHGASIISRKPPVFAEPTAETAVDEVSNLTVAVIRAQCGVYEIYKPHALSSALALLMRYSQGLRVYKFHRLHIEPLYIYAVSKGRMVLDMLVYKCAN